MSKIVDIPGAAGAAIVNSPHKINLGDVPPMSAQDANNLALAVKRYVELSGAAVVTATAEAEIAGLKEYISKQAFVHIGELMGTYFAVRQEYEPLIKTVAFMFKRVDAINQRAAAIAQAEADERAKQESPKQAEDKP